MLSYEAFVLIGISLEPISILGPKEKHAKLIEVSVILTVPSSVFTADEPIDQCTQHGTPAPAQNKPKGPYKFCTVLFHERLLPAIEIVIHTHAQTNKNKCEPATVSDERFILYISNDRPQKK